MIARGREKKGKWGEHDPCSANAVKLSRLLRTRGKEKRVPIHEEGEK